jgi:hypothetical protein
MTYSAVCLLVGITENDNILIILSLQVLQPNLHPNLLDVPSHKKIKVPDALEVPGT